MRIAKEHAGVFIGMKTVGARQEKAPDRRGDDRVENEREPLRRETWPTAMA